jgi:hypothetical protein
MKSHRIIKQVEVPYTGPRLDPKSELTFMQNADYHEASRYVRAYNLSPEGEKILVGNCRPEVIDVYIEKRAFSGDAEVLLIKRKDSRLLQKYIKRYPLSHAAQKYLVEHGRKEDLFCMVGTKFPLCDDIVKMLPSRGNGLAEAYVAPNKFRVV